MAVVAHHPVVVHLKGVAVCLLTINIDTSVAHLQVVALIGADGSFIDSDIVEREFERSATLRNPYWAIVVASPPHSTVLRINVRRSVVDVQRHALHQSGHRLQRLQRLVCQRHISAFVQQHYILFRDIKFLHQLVRNIVHEL